MAVNESRTSKRRDFTVPQRVQLAEGDLDAQEGDIFEMKALLRTMNARLMGVLCSLIVAVVMLALNLAVK